VSYTYNAATVSNAQGRLTAMTYGTNSSTGSYYSYDAMGRVTTSYQRIDAQTYQMSYGYNLAGELSSQTYPSGRVVTTGYDSAGRVSGVTGQKAGEGNKSYAAGFSYTAAGAVSAMQMGNGLVEQAGFNARLQPVQIKLGTVTSPASVVQLDYGYGTTNNNGNLLSQTITAPKTAGGSLVLTQTYGYDSLNRLVSAGENGTAWQQTYDCDRFGNRAVRRGGGTSYLTNDHLGSTRVVTKSDGSVKARYGFLPYRRNSRRASAGAAMW
jgi:YD repeat-containing protein